MFAAKFENVALNRPTEQSSTLGQYYGKSAHAVDGNSNNRIYGASCTRTNNEANPWWRVDLEQERNVFEVKVVNRGDCCGSYLTGFQVRIGELIPSLFHINIIFVKYILLYLMCNIKVTEIGNKKDYISCCDSKFHAIRRSSELFLSMYRAYEYIQVVLI